MSRLIRTCMHTGSIFSFKFEHCKELSKDSLTQKLWINVHGNLWGFPLGQGKIGYILGLGSDANPGSQNPKSSIIFFNFSKLWDRTLLIFSGKCHIVYWKESNSRKLNRIVENKHRKNNNAHRASESLKFWIFGRLSFFSVFNMLLCV